MKINDIHLQSWDDKGCICNITLENGINIHDITYIAAKKEITFPEGVFFNYDDNGFCKFETELVAVVDLNYRTAVGMYGARPAKVTETKIRIPYTLEEIRKAETITGKLSFDQLPEEIQDEVVTVHNEVIMTCEGGSAAEWEERFCEKIGAFIDGDRRAGKKFFAKLYDYFCYVKHHDFGVTNICILESKMR